MTSALMRVPRGSSLVHPAAPLHARWLSVLHWAQRNYQLNAFWLVDLSKLVSDRITKLSRDLLVLELGRPGRDVMQTIVAH
jgi:hypothetical protein